MKLKRFVESVEEKEYSEGQRVLISFLNQLFGEYVKVELLDFEYDIVGYDLVNHGDVWSVFYLGIKIFSIVEDGKFYDLDEIWHRGHLMTLISNSNAIISNALKEKIKEGIV